MEEEKKPEIIPTKDLEIDETQLTEEDRKEIGFHVAKIPLIIMVVLVVLIIVCVIVIMAMGGPVS